MNAKVVPELSNRTTRVSGLSLQPAPLIAGRIAPQVRYATEAPKAPSSATREILRLAAGTVQPAGSLTTTATEDWATGIVWRTASSAVPAAWSGPMLACVSWAAVGGSSAPPNWIRVSRIPASWATGGVAPGLALTVEAPNALRPSPEPIGS